MSLIRPACTTCSTSCDCERVAWYRAGDRSLFGVAWKCPRCSDRKLVVSPLGPSRIGKTTCLHCGAEGSSDRTPCTRCGTSIRDVLSDRERDPSNVALLELAREAFAIGTCRRALTITNLLVQRGTCDEAATIKAQFIEHLDAQQPFS